LEFDWLFGDICTFLDISALLGHSKSGCAACDAVLVEENACERDCISMCCILLKYFEPLFGGFPSNMMKGQNILNVIRVNTNKAQLMAPIAAAPLVAPIASFPFGQISKKSPTMSQAAASSARRAKVDSQKTTVTHSSPRCTQ
jgi:hypothetical protein